MATAIDAQVKNAEIQKQNREMAIAWAPGINTIKQTIADEEAACSRLQKEYADTMIKLFDEIPKEELFEKLRFSNTRIEVSQSGAWRIFTDACMEGELIIFDELKAVIDGTVEASLYDGDKMVSSAVIVLPEYGLGNAKALKGMARSGAMPEKAYKVVFTPKDLWAIEI